MKQPRLTIDEVILLVNTYFCIKNTKNEKVKKEYAIELSNNMKKLPIHDFDVSDLTFRSIDGMNMLLLNIASFDKDCSSYLRNSSALQEKIYNKFENNIEILKGIAKSIISVCNMPFEYRKYEETEFYGGNILLQYHKYLEKTDKTIQQMREAAISRNITTCQVCKRDLFDIYGDLGVALLEQHYSYPIYEYSAEMQILSSNVVNLCPACHKLAHSAVELFEENKMKDSLKDRGCGRV